MDNQKIMQNKQPVVIQRTSEETDTVQKAGAQFKTDQQKAAEQVKKQQRTSRIIRRNRRISYRSSATMRSLSWAQRI